MSDYVVVLSTCPTEISNDLARSLVKKRLCACINIIPKVTSFYFWKDEIVEDSESILMMKTDSSHIESLWHALKQEHPYEIPEYIVLRVKWGSQDYLDWISHSLVGQ